MKQFSQIQVSTKFGKSPAFEIKCSLPTATYRFLILILYHCQVLSRPFFVTPLIRFSQGFSTSKNFGLL